MGLGEDSGLGRADPTPTGLGIAATIGASGASTVAIELTRSQILQVCECADESGYRADALGELGVDARRLGGLLDEVARNPRPKFSKSLVSGLYVLAGLPDDGMPVGIAELAEVLDMPSGTVHRYLHTLIVAELVQRDEKTRKYYLVPGIAGTSALAAEDK